MTPSRLRHRLAVLAITGLATVTLAACFNPFDPLVSGVGTTEPPPVPDSPGNTLRLLEWCYEHRALAEYRELFTDDYRFVFGQLDPDGNAYRDNPWTREDEMESATRLFQGGGANQQAAASIVLKLDPNFRVTDDPRYPTSGRWRKLIRTSVVLRVVDVNQAESQATGFANFFLVRGDSALIPEELRQRGFGPDSTRWYITRHEDDTFPDEPEASPGRASPVSVVRPLQKPALFTTRTSWGRIKAAYR
jgi:hypothetical protein